jgi:hypothetical protein
MRCSIGNGLRERYELAEKQKIAVSLLRVPAGERPNAAEKEFLVAKQKYLESFADWLSHKAFCHDCKPKA